MRKVYLDYAATTPTHPDIEAQIRPFLTETFGNPSSTHGFGRKAREAIEKAREQVARSLGCAAEEVVFTSGGTEADNAAIAGAALAGRAKGRHVVTTAIEHHAVLNTCEFLETLGYEVTYVQPNAKGLIEIGDFLQALRPSTVVASCMWVNNETGAIQPVAELAKGCLEAGVPFHSDGVQAAGVLPIHVKDTGLSLLSVSSHKLYGPKGVGALIVKRGTPWKPILHGGNQEVGRRGGTENVPAIVGFGAAIERVHAIREQIYAHLTRLKGLFVARISAGVPDLEIHSPENSVPSIVSLGFPGVKNEVLLMNLDIKGIAASSGSACTAGSLQPSHVLLAMGLPVETVRSAVRFSFSEQNSLDEVEYAADVVVELVNRLRST